MLEFLKKKKPTQFNKDTPVSANKELHQIRKRVVMQLGLAVLTILLTVVLLFGMTAAWYTNVVYSGGLIFEVEKMGVNVNAAVYTDSFTAQPGDYGDIYMEAVNKSDDTVQVTISVSKIGMEQQMQQRLYFYVEDQKVINDELVQRCYLTTTATHTYTLFGGNSLTLTGEYHNDSPLKWCWVYDVLGYYVTGKAQDGDVEVYQYLRPIEYDYDRATFDVNGNLLTVDGTTTVDSFLTIISQSDGYPGTINSHNMVGRYYQVDVDEDGYGVYAYLCTYAEVETNTQYDTALGEAAYHGNPAIYTARFTVTAETVEQTAITVTDATQLIDALTAGGKQTIRLEDDVALEKDTALTFVNGSDTLLDLNGHTITTDTSDYAWTLENDASLTITGGTLSGNDAGNGFYLTGAELTLNDVDINGYNRGFYVQDFGGDQDSTLHFTGCNIQTSSHLLLLFGNGTDSEQKMQVMVENCILTSQQYVISGNGNLQGSGRWGTDVQIINSQLIQDISNGSVFAAIYHPQKDSILNIYDSYISGYTGIAIKGGAVTVRLSEVVGVGENPAEPELTKDGFYDTADGIYVETGYGYEMDITIQDSTVTSYHSEAFRVFEEGATCVTVTQEGYNFFYSKILVSETEENA